MQTMPPVQVNTRGIIEPFIPGAIIDYYRVSGNTTAVLRDDLNQQHPINNLDGHTAWHVCWNWPGLANTGCDPGAVKLDTQLSVTLPRWSPSPDTDTALILHWNDYLGSLTTHEQGHVKMARQGFGKMQEILRNSSCADAKLNIVRNEMHEANLRYDTETRHDQTQGAKLP